MTYHDVEHVRDRMGELQAHVRSAILAENTREMTQQGTTAQALAAELQTELSRGLNSSSDSPFPARVERPFAEAAAAYLERAVTQGQRVALGTDVGSVRSGLLEVKTCVDFADAYLRAALGDFED